VTPRTAALVAIAVGGGVGALARAGLGEAVPASRWPWATFIANIAGTLLLGGVAATIALRPHPLRWIHPLVAVGFCGSLTTFAAVQVESVLMMRDGRPLAAVAYVAATMVLGLVAAIGVRRAVEAGAP
jgi:fluoride exporter